MAGWRQFAPVALAACMPLMSPAQVITRPVTLTPVHASTAAEPYCAVLDADIFAASGPGLRGLQLEQDGKAIPFLTTVSAPVSDETVAAQVKDLREDHADLRFDLVMPAGAYTALSFHLRVQDFVITGRLSADDPTASEELSRVGSFVLFDLSREKLGSKTLVALPELYVRTLHVTLHAPGRVLHAGDLAGVDVPPDRAAQSVYTDVAPSAKLANTEHETIAEFDVPAHIPVQRIHFDWQPAKENFQRRVRVEAWPQSDPQVVETISGTISNVARTAFSIALSDVQHDVPMTLGANLHGAAHVRVIVENEEEKPLPLNSITLQMRQHKICFDAPVGDTLALVESEDATPVQLAMPQQDWTHAGKAEIGAAAQSGIVSIDLTSAVDYNPWGLDRRVMDAIVFGVFSLTILTAWLLIRFFLRRKKKARSKSEPM